MPLEKDHLTESVLTEARSDFVALPEELTIEPPPTPGLRRAGSRGDEKGNSSKTIPQQRLDPSPKILASTSESVRFLPSMALNAPCLTPNPVRRRAFGGKNRPKGDGLTEGAGERRQSRRECKRKFLFLLLYPALLSASIPLPTEIGEQTEFEVSTESGAFTATAEKLSVTNGVGWFTIRFASPIESAHPENNRVTGELFLRLDQEWTGDPVVLLHILNGDFSLERLIALELATAGVPSFWFKLPFYGDRRPAEISSSRPVSPSQLLQLIDQGAHDFQRSCDFMTLWQRDSDSRINVTGISMGALLGFHFASLEPRVGKISSIMGGGDLWGIIQTARETRGAWEAFSDLSQEERDELQKEVAARDPLQAAAILRPKALAGDILMINATEDEVIPRIHAEQLGAALGIQDAIVWMEGVGHYSMAARFGEIIQRQVDFFTDTSAVPESAKAAPTLAIEPDGVLFARFLDQLSLMIDPTTHVENGQRLHLDFVWQDKSGETNSGALDWRRAKNGDYSLQLNAEPWGGIGIGTSQQPWIHFADQDMLLLGSSADQKITYLDKADNGIALKLQLIATFMRFGARIPGLLEDHGTLESIREGNTTRLTYQAKRRPDRIVVDYDTSIARYTACEIHYQGNRLSIDIQAMEVDTTFEPTPIVAPKAADTLRVNSLHLQHTLALVLEVIDNKVAIGRF